MTSASLKAIFLVILSVILVDVFCADGTNFRQTNLRQTNQNAGQKSPDIPLSTSTTPWPNLGQRQVFNSRTRGNGGSTSTTHSPKKWIQQNNIWIRNEQASSEGIVGVPAQDNRQGFGTRRPSNQVTQKKLIVDGTSTSAKPPLNRGSTFHQDNRQQALLNSLGGNHQNNIVSASTSAKPPLIRGDTYTVLKPQPQNNKQQALIDGLGGNNLPPPSSTPQPTKKPMSYAGAVNSKQPLPSPSGPKTPPILPPINPTGGTNQDKLSSTGPVSEKVEDFDADENVNTASGDSSVTDEELREFSEMLLRKDTNNAMKYVTLNLQGMTTSRSTTDQAPSLLLNIDDAAYKIPSIEKMMLLYNNYFLDAGQNEVYTGQERIEENNLLDAVLATPVMQYARSFLVQKGKIGKDPKEFRDLLRQIWFNMYSRGRGRIGSSGFEHVFLAEIKNNQVSGLHNWVYFNEEESQKRANYLGYMKKIDLGEKGAILKYHFTFHDIDKPVGSMFIGTSPEMEMALYSTCFVLRADSICPLKMNGNRFIIRTFTFRYRGKNMIGSAFPEI